MRSHAEDLPSTLVVVWVLGRQLLDHRRGERRRAEEQPELRWGQAPHYIPRRGSVGRSKIVSSRQACVTTAEAAAVGELFEERRIAATARSFAELRRQFGEHDDFLRRELLGGRPDPIKWEPE